MFSIITRIEVTSFQTLGTCAEVRLGREQSWGVREGTCLVSCTNQGGLGPKGVVPLTKQSPSRRV